MNRSLLKLVGFMAAGGAVGFAYYYFVGCASGSCPITSSPYISTLYGAFVGFLAHGGFKRPRARASDAEPAAHEDAKV